MSNVPSESAPMPKVDNDSIFGPRRITQTLVILTVIVFCFAFHFGARLIGWPREPRFEGSLAQGPVAIGGFFAALVLLIACSAIGTLLLGRRWYLAGLMTATAGLSIWSVRGGVMTFVLMRADSSGSGNFVFIEMLLELIVFFGIIAGIWNYIWANHRPRELFEQKDREEGRSAGAALVAQGALMTVFVLILAATAQKKQVLTAVFLAGMFSTAIAEQFFADRNAGRWYWIGPLAAGAFGYIAGFMSPAGLETGDLTGAFGPLAHVLPLDYASLGCAGSLLGYWWMMGEDEEEEPAEEK